MSSDSNNTHQSLNTTSDKNLFVDNISCAIMSNLNRDSDIYNTVKEIRKDVNLKEEPVASKDFHITLHQLNFNKSHPQTKKIRDNLKNIVKECYEIMFDNVDLLFNGYEIYGNFFVMKLKVSKELITDFRMCLYKNIEKILGVKIKGPGKHNKFIYETTENDNTPLYGLNEAFYYGKNNWAPHISLFKLNEKLISDPSKTVKDYIEEKGGNLQDIESIKSKFDSLKKYDKTIGFNNKNFFDIKISLYSEGVKNEIKTIDLKKGKKTAKKKTVKKKTKKLKSSIKKGNKKTKKNLKVHFKEKAEVIKYKDDEKSNVKKEVKNEPISDKPKKLKRKKKDKGEKNDKNEKNGKANFKNDRKENVELHPNEINLQKKNNNAKKIKGKKVKNQRFVNDNTVEDRVKKNKKGKKNNEEESGETFGVFSWNVIMLVGAIIAPIFVYKDVMLNV